MIHLKTESKPMKVRLAQFIIFISFSLTAFYFYDTSASSRNKSIIFENKSQPITRERVSAALTPQILNKIKKDLIKIKRLSYAKIAKKYNLSAMTIYDIDKGKRKYL